VLDSSALEFALRPLSLCAALSRSVALPRCDAVTTAADDRRRLSKQAEAQRLKVETLEYGCNERSSHSLQLWERR
jgi:hypothetical protein